MSERWDAPIGTAEERAAAQVWPAWWFDACPYGTRYVNSATGRYVVHTGADLNLNAPFFNADAHALVYAPCAGVVRHVVTLPVWGNVIILEHATAGGKVYTRFGHVEEMSVHPGQVVQRGDPLCKVGNGRGVFPYHLHYDIASCNLAVRPGHWPGDNPGAVRADYFDPLQYTRERHVMAAHESGAYYAVILAQPTLRVRQGPATSYNIVGHVPFGTVKQVVEVRSGWGRIESPAGWIALQWTARHAGAL